MIGRNELAKAPTAQRRYRCRLQRLTQPFLLALSRRGRLERTAPLWMANLGGGQPLVACWCEWQASASSRLGRDQVAARTEQLRSCHDHRQMTKEHSMKIESAVMCQSRRWQQRRQQMTR